MRKLTLQASFLAVLLTFGLTSCTDWDQQDPEAGNQTYPDREVVATYDFEYSDKKPEFSDLGERYDLCEVVKDDSLGSNVLHLSGAGAARVVNPFKDKKLQDGAAISFYVKTDSADLARPLFAFTGETSDSTFYFTPNGQLKYTVAGQLQSLNLDDNDPADNKTGILSPGKWHFVALQVSNTGYQLYIDGNKSLSGAAASKSSTSFSYKTLVNFINHAPYLYIGTDTIGARHNDVAFDDITLYRNHMVEKDWNKKAGAVSWSWKETESIGLDDLSSPFFGPKTPNMEMTGDGTVHYQFTCKTQALNNYETWVLAITNGIANGENGYTEYEICRGDAWCWGSLLNKDGEGVTNSYNWDTWKQDMNGATVDLYITRNDGIFTVNQYVKTAGGTDLGVCTWKTSKPCPTEKWGTFLTLEKAQLTFTKAEVYTATDYSEGAYEIGSEDNSSAFFDKKSEMYDFTADRKRMTIKFVNTTNGANNWENYVVAFASTPFGADGYSEYAVCRADAWSWGKSLSKDGANVTASYNWDTWKQDINGATVTLDFKRVGARVDMTADVVTAKGEKLPQMKFFVDGLEGKPLYIFITNEKSCQKILQVRDYPWFNKNFADFSTK